MTLAVACQRLGISKKTIYSAQDRQKGTLQQALDWWLAKRDGTLIKPVKEKKPPRPRIPGPPKPSDPATHYLPNEQFLAEVLRSQQRGRCTDRLGMQLMLLAKKFFKRYNLHRYSFVDEMRDAALMAAFAKIDNFSIEKSQNAFGYFTQIMKHSAIRYLNKEKRQWQIQADQGVIYQDALEQEAPGSQSRHRRS
jgi:hypothetical protein